MHVYVYYVPGFAIFSLKSFVELFFTGQKTGRWNNEL